VRILVSNDDGVYADGIWALAQELSKIAEVTIVAPDREQSAVGTAVSLRKPLRVQNIVSLHPGIKAYSVEGTPSDSVIVGLGRLVPAGVDLVVSGINQGSNMGEDVLISGTVGAALAAYLRGFPAMAVSCDRKNWQKPYLHDIARLAALIAGRIRKAALPSNVFLNLNVPDPPLAEARGVKITSLARKSHVNSVEEGHDGSRAYYTLVREAVNQQVDSKSDIWNVSRGYVSITPLHLFLDDHISTALLEKMTAGLLEEYRQTASARTSGV
jgi:5'-nucleotidase